MNDTEINKLWENSGFLSKVKFYKYLKAQGHKITQKEIETFLNKKETRQIIAQPKKQTEFNTIISPAPKNNYQIDIMVMTRNPRNGYKYILGCIDVYSRYAMCIPLRSRESATENSDVFKAFKTIMTKMGIPKNINADNEFTSKPLKKYIENNNITLWLSYADEAVINSKNAIIERFWRTLAAKLRDYKNNTGDADWPSYLSKIVDSYNNTYHDTVKGKPDDLFNGRDTNKQIIKRVEHKFKVGDIVRLRQKKTIFSKGDEETFSRDIYAITRKDDKYNNRWVITNTKTGKELERGYLERDFSIVNDIIKPNITVREKIQKDKEVKKQNLISEKVKNELKNLQTEATDKITKAKDSKRKVKKPLKYRD